MTEPKLEISPATETDLGGILALMADNQQSRGGMLAAELPRDRVLEMMSGMPQVVARRAGRVVGFLMATTRELNGDLAVIRAMFSVYPGSPNAYVYGPICVDQSERGRGLAAAMFSELRRLEPGREGVLFIRSDNEASLVAHQKMGMREVARFTLGAADFAVFSYIG